MSFIGNILVLFHWLTLFRLRRRIKNNFPEALAKIMHDRWLGERLAGALFPRWHKEMGQLQHLALAYPDRLPVYILGDDEITRLVGRLRRSTMLALYAYLAVAVASLWNN